MAACVQPFWLLGMNKAFKLNVIQMVHTACACRLRPTPLIFILCNRISFSPLSDIYAQQKLSLSNLIFILRIYFSHSWWLFWAGWRQSIARRQTSRSFSCSMVCFRSLSHYLQVVYDFPVTLGALPWCSLYCCTGLSYVCPTAASVAALLLATAH